MQLHIYSPKSTEAITCDLDAMPVTIGRADHCQVQLPFAIVSGQHMRLFQDAQGQYLVEDIGSTNGTSVNGTKLTPHQPTAIFHNTTISVLELRIVVDLSRASKEGFTLAERDTFVRQMVSQALRQEHEGEDLAFFEIIRGPRRGHRVFLPDTLTKAWVGRAEDAHFKLGESAPDHVAMIVRQGDGFMLHPQPGAVVAINDESALAATALRSRQRVVMHETECIFFDPLQEYLDELEGNGPEALTPEIQSNASLEQTPRVVDHATPDTLPPLTPHPSAPTSAPTSEPTLQPATTDAVAAVPAPPKTGLSAVEVGLLVMTLLFITGGVVILLVVFGVIST